MSEFLGSRISLISKSDIRYSGVLHEINSEESTVSLENVRSFGTEGRRGKPDEELPPSDQVYEYIVFRGSDVKDLRIEEGPTAKENKPPAVPDDPAIVGARPRPTGPGNAASGPHIPQGPPPGAPGFNQPHFQQNFYPPGPGGPGGPGGPWGRGGGPGPGPDPRFGGMPYPPPPGWFPPGQGFPPGAPGPWNNFGYQPGPHAHPGAPPQGMRGTPPQDNNKPAPIGAGAAPGAPQSKPGGTPSHAELPSEPKSLGQPPMQPTPAASGPAPTPPVDSKPSVEEVKATSDSLAANGAQRAAQQSRNAPTGPKSKRVTPAVPSFPIPAFPGGIQSKQGQATQPQAAAAAVAVKPAGDSANGAPSAASIRDATQQAKEAVAVAMAKLNAGGAGGAGAGVPAHPSNGSGSAIDNLTKKVDEMRVNATRGGPGSRGRGRGNRQGGPAKVDVPDADFDFQTSNAKFNKGDLVKEAATGSPLGDVPNGGAPETPEGTDSTLPPAYNKTRSFFDNISSEARERAESGGQKPGGREWRGEEQRKNMETFGQGSVDGAYRGFRGRGRGRGRGVSRGGRGYGTGPRGGGYRPRGGESDGTAQ